MEAIIQDFLELVQINSDTLFEREMADNLTKKLKDLGCQVTEDDVGAKIGGNAGNLHAIYSGSLPGSVLFLAHMDRVPGGQNIHPMITEDVIRTDGQTILAADDLAGVCAILDCLRRLKASGKPHCSVEILFTVSEEVSLRGSKNLDYAKLQSKNAYVFDSSGRIGRIICAAPSKANIEIHIHGKSAHAGNEPEAGIDAAKICGKILATLNIGRLDSETVSNFPCIRTGNTSTNIVCDYAQVIGEARSLDHSKLEAYIAYLKKTVADITAGTGANAEVHADIGTYAFCVDSDDITIQNAVKAMNQLNITPKITKGGGCMDANWLNKYGIRSVGIATGYMNNHTTQEKLYVQDFLLSGQLAEQLVREYSTEKNASS